MKVKFNNLSTNKEVIESVEMAVLNHIGTIGRQSRVLAKTIDKLCENGHIKTAQLEEILGYGYEVRMD